MAKVSKEVNKGVLENLGSWLINVNPYRGLNDYVYIILYQLLIVLFIIGVKENSYKGYFELSVMAFLVIIIVGLWDRRMSQSDNGFYSVFNWISAITFFYGCIYGNYGLYFSQFKYVIAFTIMFIIVRYISILTERRKKK